MERRSSLHAPLSVTTHPPLEPRRLRLRTHPRRIRLEGVTPGSASFLFRHQPRATKALRIGIEMEGAGHVFVCGPPGTARKALIEAALQRYGKPLEPPRDYLSLPSGGNGLNRPLWIGLPAGRGRILREVVEEWVEAFRERIRAGLRGGEDLEQAIRRMEESLRERLAEFRGRLDLDAHGLGLLEVLAGTLAARAKRLGELALACLSGPGGGGLLERLWHEAEALADCVPHPIREAEGDGPPVVFEPNPTLRNLFGYVIRREEGSRANGSNHFLFQAGSLLRAQGGYLVLDFEELAGEPGAWKHLKRCLRYGMLELPSPEGTGEMLRPEPIPLKVKLLVWGEEDLYEEFYHQDPAFGEIFRIRADLDTQTDRNDEAIQGYLAFLTRCREQEGLLPFDPTGAAAFIDAGAEMAGRQRKLSTRWGLLTELAREASYLARREGSRLVRARHIERAQEARRFRKNLPEEQVHEGILDNTVLIQTDGFAVGQANGIALYETEDHLFGRPCRITAQVGMGRSGVINVEREVNLSGKIHDKGMLILCGFLRNRFAQNKPLTLSASICIEQFYSDIDGDSASLGEVCALLSSLADVPIHQGIAVTGSISQMGDVQAVGGVNEKILGFFDVCLRRGLTGKQGVIIPAGNVEDLMLPARVIEAVERRRFHIYAVRTVDEAMEILTGRAAGSPDRDGRFPQGSLNERVDERLWHLACGLRDFYGEEEDGEDTEGGTPSVE